MGWVDVDPTHGSFVADDYVTVGRRSRLLGTCLRIAGLWKGRAEETINVTVKVEPVDRVPPRMERLERSRLPTFRSGMFQTQRMGHMSQSQRMGRSPYPNQRSYGAGLHQQQGEQQQQEL